ncbi:hypothetical protein ACIGDM_01105 [Rothia koreensis]|uniref:hypothetical protein n=1 Tax=Rothia koreensis TaxID=592378 RepID=UPI0037C8FCCB
MILATISDHPIYPALLIAILEPLATAAALVVSMLRFRKLTSRVRELEIQQRVAAAPRGPNQ